MRATKQTTSYLSTPHLSKETLSLATEKVHCPLCPLKTSRLPERRQSEATTHCCQPSPPSPQATWVRAATWGLSWNRLSSPTWVGPATLLCQVGQCRGQQIQGCFWDALVIWRRNWSRSLSLSKSAEIRPMTRLPEVARECSKMSETPRNMTRWTSLPCFSKCSKTNRCLSHPISLAVQASQFQLLFLPNQWKNGLWKETILRPKMRILKPNQSIRCLAWWRELKRTSTSPTLWRWP